MKKAKTLLTLLTIVAMTFAMCVNVSAADTVEKIKFNTSYERNFSGTFYEFTLPKAAEVTINVSSQSTQFFYVELSQDKTRIDPTGNEFTKGNYYAYVQRVNVTDTGAKGKLTYTLAKGTYKVKIYGGSGLIKFSVSVPQDVLGDVTPSAYIEIAKGASVKLTSDAGGVTWKSSKATVAAVDSSGKVTGKAAGTATITATVGGVSQKFTVKVK